MKKGCEDFVNKFLPVIRAALVKRLFNEYAMTQKEIASKLGISQPMVSYFLRQEKGSKDIERINKKEIDAMVKNILVGEDFSDNLCKACLKLTKTKCIVR